MAVNEENPLITRADLITAVKKHFMKDLKVDGPELIAKFLSLKKEERNPISFLNRQSRSRPQRVARKTVDFTPSNPAGGQSLGSYAQAAARATPFNPNEPSANQVKKVHVNIGKHA